MTETNDNAKAGMPEKGKPSRAWCPVCREDLVHDDLIGETWCEFCEEEQAADPH